MGPLGAPERPISRRFTPSSMGVATDPSAPPSCDPGPRGLRSAVGVPRPGPRATRRPRTQVGALGARTVIEVTTPAPTSSAIRPMRVGTSSRSWVAQAVEPRLDTERAVAEAHRGGVPRDLLADDLWPPRDERAGREVDLPAEVGAQLLQLVAEQARVARVRAGAGVCRIPYAGSRSSPAATRAASGRRPLPPPRPARASAAVVAASRSPTTWSAGCRPPRG